jgi:hypothetical protein
VRQKGKELDLSGCGQHSQSPFELLVLRSRGLVAENQLAGPHKGLCVDFDMSLNLSVPQFLLLDDNNHRALLKCAD